MVTVVSGKPRTGQTSVVANLACALAGQGKSVLVIDEGIGADSCAARLGLAPRIELLQVLKGQAPLAQALLPYNDAIHVLPAREGLRRPSPDGPRGQAVPGRRTHLLAIPGGESEEIERTTRPWPIPGC